jgi:hypothetical protein
MNKDATQQLMEAAAAAEMLTATDIMIWAACTEGGWLLQISSKIGPKTARYHFSTANVPTLMETTASGLSAPVMDPDRAMTIVARHLWYCLATGNRPISEEISG